MDGLNKDFLYEIFPEYFSPNKSPVGHLFGGSFNEKSADPDKEYCNKITYSISLDKPYWHISKIEPVRV